MIYYIWIDRLDGIIKGMLKEDYEKPIRDAHKVAKFDRFESLEEVKEYINKYSTDCKVEIIK